MAGIQWSAVLAQVKALVPVKTSGLDDELLLLANIAQQDVWDEIIDSPHWDKFIQSTAAFAYTAGGVLLAGLGATHARVLVAVHVYDSNGEAMGHLEEISMEESSGFDGAPFTPGRTRSIQYGERYYLDGDFTLHLVPEPTAGFGTLKALYIPDIDDLTLPASYIFNGYESGRWLRRAFLYRVLFLYSRRQHTRARENTWADDYREAIDAAINLLRTRSVSVGVKEEPSGF